jgi:carbamoyl-phosphate synthase large subunit
VPFVSKATGVAVAKAAARIMLGASIAELRREGVLPAYGDGGDIPAGTAIAVKEAVLPFGRFHGVDAVLGPEMRSTGEVMGIDDSFGVAFAKSQQAAYTGGLPTGGRAFVSLANRDKRAAVFPIKRLADLGFAISATAGTADVLRRNGVDVQVLRKQHEGPGDDGTPTTVEAIMAGDIDLIVNTVSAPIDLGPVMNLLKTDGTMAYVGLPDKPLAVNVFSLNGQRRNLTSSTVGGIPETQEMLDFCAEHGYAADIEVIGADRINEAWERVVNSDVRYRFVIDASTF